MFAFQVGFLIDHLCELALMFAYCLLFLFFFAEPGLVTMVVVMPCRGDTAATPRACLQKGGHSVCHKQLAEAFRHTPAL